MDVLKDKTYKSYNITNRYETFPYYYHTLDDKYVYGITSQVNKDISYVEVEVKDYHTLENLAYTYYGKSYYYWIIADFNDITDPFINLQEKFKNKKIKIPTLTAVTWSR